MVKGLIISLHFYLCLLLISGCRQDSAPDLADTDSGINFTIARHLYPGQAVQSIAFTSKDSYYYSVGNQISLKENEKEVVSFSAGSTVYSMAFRETDQSLYFGTHSSGLGRLKNGLTDYFTVENSGLPRNLVSKVVTDASGNVWFNSSAHNLGGLMRFNGVSIQKYLPENSPIPGNIIYNITTAGADVYLSVAGLNSGTFFMKVSGNQWEQVLSTKGCWILSTLEIDHAGRLYYTEDSREYCGGGLLPDIVVYTFVNNQKVIIREGEWGSELTPYIVKSDKRNNIWTAKFYKEGYGTLSVYNREKWVKAPPGFPRATIRCIEVDEENSIWLGTDDGIYILEQKKVKELKNR